MSLRFKGEKKKKKRSHREIDGDDGEQRVDRGEGTSVSAKAKYGKNPEGWVLLLDEADLVGPTFVTSKTSLSQQGVPLALCSNPINNKVYLFPLPEDMTAESAEPTQVDAIWRVARVPESDTMVTLKSAQDRFLACDQVGSVSAEREARGPQEEFVLESAQDKHGKGAFAIKSASFNKYLSVDEVAGGKLELRCDAEAVGDDEVFFCKMQAEFLGKNEEERNRKQRKMTQNDGLIIIGDLKGAENANILKYQARGAGKIVSSEASSKELRKAQKEGRLAEEMLDRRMKLKSDRYC